jgi:hypothetical protein
MIGTLSVNRLAVLNNSYFYEETQIANYNFNICLANDNWELVDSSYTTYVPATATITGADYEPAFNNFSYAQPIIEAQAANW